MKDEPRSELKASPPPGFVVVVVVVVAFEEEEDCLAAKDEDAEAKDGVIALEPVCEEGPDDGLEEDVAARMENASNPGLEVVRLPLGFEFDSDNSDEDDCEPKVCGFDNDEDEGLGALEFHKSAKESDGMMTKSSGSEVVRRRLVKMSSNRWVL